MTAEPGANKSTKAWDWVAGSVLFLSTAAVVLWQNSRLAVIWDLSYILENAWRISIGQIPYRDFPFPYAPVTFLVQALLIRLTGRVYFHHIAYAAVAGALGTVLTWRILIRLLRGATPWFRLLSFLLAAPLAALGIYCIYPHPFYDPDCTLIILGWVLLLLRLEETDFPAAQTFLLGMACVLPLFVKQNTGLAFLAILAFCALLVIAAEAWNRGSIAPCVWLLAGIATGLSAAALIIHLTAGLGSYWRWTMQFAASRRLPAFSEMLDPYRNWALLLWLATFAAGAFLLWRNKRLRRWLSILAIVLMAAPFAWPVIYLFLDDDTSERAERLLALWPVVMTLAVPFALWSLRRGVTLARLTPLILLGTIQGAFLSQQLWGSTYAIWPFLMILLAGILAELWRLVGGDSRREIVALAAIASLCLIVAGGFYVSSGERLSYADLTTGDLARSTLPTLAGLSTPGPWIPDFEELVRYTDLAIPRNDGLLMIPGEDPFYFATGRHPQFPALLFDRTINPYSPEEILELSRQRHICWFILKKKIQRNDQPVEDKDRLLSLLRADFEPFHSLANYEIYHGSAAHGCPREPD